MISMESIHTCAFLLVKRHKKESGGRRIPVPQTGIPIYRAQGWGSPSFPRKQDDIFRKPTTRECQKLRDFSPCGVSLGSTRHNKLIPERPGRGDFVPSAFPHLLLKAMGWEWAQEEGRLEMEEGWRCRGES